MIENESAEKLHVTSYYESFMRGYYAYMSSEKLSFEENPKMLDFLSDIYLKAKRAGMEYEHMKLEYNTICDYGVDDGWAAAKSANTDKGEYVICSNINSDTDKEALHSSENGDGVISHLEDSEGELDEWSADNIWEDEICKDACVKKLEVTQEYIRGFLSGYSDYLYEHGISIKENEQLKSCLRVSFLRALDPYDDMSAPFRIEDKTQFYPGVMDGRRCAELDIERNSVTICMDDERDFPCEKEKDLLNLI